MSERQVPADPQQKPVPRWRWVIAIVLLGLVPTGIGAGIGYWRSIPIRVNLAQIPRGTPSEEVCFLRPVELTLPDGTVLRAKRATLEVGCPGGRYEFRLSGPSGTGAEVARQARDLTSQLPPDFFASPTGVENGIRWLTQRATYTPAGYQRIGQGAGPRQEIELWVSGMSNDRFQLILSGKW